MPETPTIPVQGSPALECCSEPRPWFARSRNAGQFGSDREHVQANGSRRPTDGGSSSLSPTCWVVATNHYPGLDESVSPRHRPRMSSVPWRTSPRRHVVFSISDVTTLDPHGHSSTPTNSSRLVRHTHCSHSCGMTSLRRHPRVFPVSGSIARHLIQVLNIPPTPQRTLSKNALSWV